VKRFALAILALLTTTAAADPTTQTCLGDFAKLLTCPANAQRSGTECRAKGPQWSGTQRQGPSLFMRDDKVVSFAATYKDHKKTGRVFSFDDQGRLASWSDMANDEYNGLSVSCLPDGRIAQLAYYKDGKPVGIARSWRTRDGAFTYAIEYDAQGRSHNVAVSPQLMQRPDYLCQPQRCDIHAKPDLSGIPSS
jgi:hypothetical protein